MFDTITWQGLPLKLTPSAAQDDASRTKTSPAQSVTRIEGGKLRHRRVKSVLAGDSPRVADRSEQPSEECL